MDPDSFYGNPPCKGMDVTGSNHYCSVTNNRVCGWCHLPEEQEYDSKAPCTRCRQEDIVQDASLILTSPLTNTSSNKVPLTSAIIEAAAPFDSINPEFILIY